MPSSIDIEVGGTTTTVETDTPPPVVEIGEVGPQGPPGETGVQFTAEASETIAALRAVRTLSDGTLAIFSPVTHPNLTPCGISEVAGAAGDDVRVVVSGVLEVAGAGFTPGSRYWVKASGVLTAVLGEVTSLAAIVEVGTALDATHLAVRIAPTIQTP